ncbi:MAG: exosortase/archaeosortase family protein [Verrucomicrobiota bacterium]
MPSREKIVSVQERDETVRRKPPLPANLRRRLRALACTMVGLVILFLKPLFVLVDFSFHSELYSHLLLIPFISLYLVWITPHTLAFAPAPSPRFGLFPILGGLASIFGYWIAVHGGWNPATADYLAVMMFSFLAFAVGASFVFIDLLTLSRIAFPLGFLIFLIPLPEFVREAIETFSQHASAEAASLMLKLSGMPVYREGLVLQLPGFAMRVAPECSGIRSSLVLFIVGLLAGHLFLKSAWNKTLLVIAVVFLGILRNGFRIFALGQLCVQISPDMINSDLHRRGGPIFFVLSLVPLLAFLIFLRKMECRKNRLNITPSH